MKSGSTTARTGARCVVEGLQRGGCGVLFGYPGGTVLDIFNELVDAPIRFVLARHEQGAVHMADGYARATGRVGCCLVTSGPGACNTVTGLATAHMDGVPLVCVCGQVALSFIGNDAFQEADITGVTRPVTKHNFLVRDVDDLPRIMAEAFYIARNGRPGPVLVDVPKDIQQKTTPAAAPKVSIPKLRALETADMEAVRRLADALNRSHRPMLLAGGGVISGNAAAPLRRLAKKASVPVATTLMGLGAFPEDDPLALRMAGMHGSPAANLAINHCDLLISAGARFDDRVTGKLTEFAPHATIAHIDCDVSSINKSVRTHIGVHGYARPVLEALCGLAAPAKRPAWLAQTAAWRAGHPFGYDPAPGGRIAPQAVIEALQKLRGGASVIVTDVGQHQMWSAHFLRYARPRTFISSGGLGTMGFGLPAAIGAQFGRPGARVVCVSGDGGIQMNFQELVVAVEHDLPVKVVVLNNGHLGMVRQWQELFYDRRYSAVVLGQRGRPANEGVAGNAAEYLPDFVALAKAHGAEAARVTRVADVEPALKKAFSDARPWLVECVVEPDANVFPMVPPGKSVKDMIFNA
ncbi:MAG: biosynthetic-type acetolactate synthase large subunit [Kiritimatiellaeota bacterium]|nr:biosynthetic-type acetolactate synthase large subunit [Kiritimatiellota bacterium]